jgi:hypothetical protein
MLGHSRKRHTERGGYFSQTLVLLRKASQYRSSRGMRKRMKQHIKYRLIEEHGCTAFKDPISTRNSGASLNRPFSAIVPTSIRSRADPGITSRTVLEFKLRDLEDFRFACHRFGRVQRH